MIELYFLYLRRSVYNVKFLQREQIIDHFNNNCTDADTLKISMDVGPSTVFKEEWSLVDIVDKFANWNQL